MLFQQYHNKCSDCQFTSRQYSRLTARVHYILQTYIDTILCLATYTERVLNVSIEYAEQIHGTTNLSISVVTPFVYVVTYLIND